MSQKCYVDRKSTSHFSALHHVGGHSQSENILGIIMCVWKWVITVTSDAETVACRIALDGWIRVWCARGTWLSTNCWLIRSSSTWRALIIDGSLMFKGCQDDVTNFVLWSWKTNHFNLADSDSVIGIVDWDNHVAAGCRLHCFCATNSRIIVSGSYKVRECSTRVHDEG